MDSEHVATEGVNSRIRSHAISRGKAIVEETKGGTALMTALVTQGGDRGGDDSDGFMILLFSSSGFGIVVLAVLSALFQSSSPRFEIIVSPVSSVLFQLKRFPRDCSHK
jgi:hypothetical protein